ncbi:MAG: hypothetical protein ACRYF9_04750 [Janthinobacterium lividum]|jgi:hypothetical protein|uniref:hypothetical protein n=1 Tax=Pseudomonas TaxID=286 RepID=UPI001CFAFBF1|nr:MULTISPECIES: hypothetical protein [Pseudomonas]
MKLDVLQLLANPCDDEEDNMAMLCCYGLMGELFLMTRFPDEDEIEITFGENDPQLVRDIKVTLSADQLLIEVAAVDAGLFNGRDTLDIGHSTDAADLPEVLETLTNILKGTGTLVKGL